jgi:hypothetical protein
MGRGDGEEHTSHVRAEIGLRSVHVGHDHSCGSEVAIVLGLTMMVLMTWSSSSEVRSIICCLGTGRFGLEVEGGGLDFWGCGRTGGIER